MPPPRVPRGSMRGVKGDPQSSGISVLEVGVTVTLMRSCPVLLRDGGLEANAAVGGLGPDARSA